MSLLRAAPVLVLATLATGQLAPDWIAQLPAGAALSSGLQAIAVDPQGRIYICGTVGPSGNNDVLTAAFSPEGQLLWTRQFDGPAQWHDQARAIALAPGGIVYTVGNTPGPGSYANVLVLKHSAETGEILGTIQYSSGAFTSEYAGSIAVDPQGNIYLAGGTVGDGGDALMLSFDPQGNLRWKKTWDGPAFGPFSQDHADLVRLHPDGSPIFMLYGVWSSNHPDFIAARLDAATGNQAWLARWGTNGGEEATDLELDAAGDVYMCGVGIDLQNKFVTLKFDGDTGSLQWQRYDSGGLDDIAFALTIDAAGRLFVTGATDPDGNQSNSNDNFLTLRLDPASGSLLWQHAYGANCVGCLDTPADVIADSPGNVLVVGYTNSAPYSGDMILFALDEATGLERDRGTIGGGADETAGARFLRFDAAENLFIGGGFSNYNTGAKTMAVARFPSLGIGATCEADCELDGDLDIFDFLCFQGAFAQQAAYADCEADGDWDVFDFLCFQGLYAAGCD